MPRKPRLDAPGALHHVIARGIEKGKIFTERRDYEDFLLRLGKATLDTKAQVYAWALIPNHFHLLFETGVAPLSSVMRRLMTGYAVSFNLRHQRHGHLFQNRYKSILCDEESYLLELTRYIHLNPYRARLVRDLRDLDKYPWCGHSCLMGKEERTFQGVEEILSRFDGNLKGARKSYRNFVREGLKMGERPELVGGGLKRSAGGWSEVLSSRRRKEEVASDERILGGSDFVLEVLQEVEEREAQTLRLKRKKIGVEELCSRIAGAHEINLQELTSGSRRAEIVVGRRDVAHIAVKHLGLSGAEVARYLGVTTSCINSVIQESELSPKGRELLRLWRR
jgi:REP element-mobilizing transposase RayT